MKKLSTPIIDIKKYGGKQVAIVKGKIVASGIDTEEVLEQAKRKFPGATWRDILLVSVPQGLTVMYGAAIQHCDLVAWTKVAHPGHFCGRCTSTAYLGTRGRFPAFRHRV